MLNSKTRIQIFSILTAFLLPALLSWVLFYYHQDFQFKTTNHGVLLNPAVPEPALALDTPRRQWQIIFAPAECNDATDKTMFVLHQLRKVLGKNQDRVSLTLIAGQNCQQLAHDFRKLSFSKEQYTQLQNSLAYLEKGFSVTNKIYLLDPLGNLFMYYSSATDPMNILKDLQKVLEVSQIG